ncbi:MAG: aromatic acid exporter family protein [Sedimentibacter sp.]
MEIPKIGMRNIKTSLSVFVSLLLFQIINRENSIYACVSAVICMQNTIVDSLEKGISRIIGTIVGGITGALVLFVVTDLFSVREDMMIFIIPLGIVILIEICVAIGMKQAVVISCVVYLSILISKNRDGGYLLYTMNRVIDTSVGIIIALLINKYVVMPDRLRIILGIPVEPTETKETKETKENEIKNEEKTDTIN